MSRIAPLPESEATDKTAQTYERLKELMSLDDVPAMFLTMGRVPAFLNDFYMNFKKFVVKGSALDDRSRAAVAIAVSLKEGAGAWVDFYSRLAGAESLGAEAIAEINALVATNATYNTFFKFRELSGSDLFDGLPVGLRAHVFRDVSFDESLVEVINLAISDLNACRPCVSGHVKKARTLGLSDDAILEAIQCAAVVYSGIQFTKGAKA